MTTPERVSDVKAFSEEELNEAWDNLRKVRSPGFYRISSVGKPSDKYPNGNVTNSGAQIIHPNEDEILILRDAVLKEVNTQRIKDTQHIITWTRYKKDTETSSIIRTRRNSAGSVSYGKIYFSRCGIVKAITEVESRNKFPGRLLTAYSTKSATSSFSRCTWKESAEFGPPGESFTQRKITKLEVPDIDKLCNVSQTKQIVEEFFGITLPSIDNDRAWELVKKRYPEGVALVRGFQKGCERQPQGSFISAANYAIYDGDDRIILFTHNITCNSDQDRNIDEIEIFKFAIYKNTPDGICKTSKNSEGTLFIGAITEIVENEDEEKVQWFVEGVKEDKLFNPGSQGLQSNTVTINSTSKRYIPFVDRNSTARQPPEVFNMANRIPQLQPNLDFSSLEEALCE